MAAGSAPISVWGKTTPTCMETVYHTAPLAGEAVIWSVPSACCHLEGSLTTAWIALIRSNGGPQQSLLEMSCHQPLSRISTPRRTSMGSAATAHSRRADLRPVPLVHQLRLGLLPPGGPAAPTSERAPLSPVFRRVLVSTTRAGGPASRRTAG